MMDNKELPFNEDMIVTNENMVENDTFTEKGVYGEMFGNINVNDYACQCGNLKGRSFKDVMCDLCKTPVTSKEYFNRFGWIDLGEMNIISPILYTFLAKVMPIRKIIDFNILKPAETKEYESMGLAEFYNKYDEVFEHYTKGSDDTNLYYRLLKENRDKIFVNRIMVYSIELRPATIVSASPMSRKKKTEKDKKNVRKTKLTFDEINNKYTNIIKNKNTYEKSKLAPKLMNNIVLDIQDKYNEIFEHVIKIMSKKRGILRHYLLGYRINFSSRSVIIPGDPYHKINEIHIPYITGLEFFKFHIINILRHRKNLSYIEAHKIIKRGMRVYDQSLHDIMMHEILEKHDVRVMFNRNPTISFGSIIQLKLTIIKNNLTDYTATIHNNVLESLAADYDGDVLNIVLLIDKDFTRFMDKLAPENFLFDTNSGDFSSTFSLGRDSVVGFKNFLTL